MCDFCKADRATPFKPTINRNHPDDIPALKRELIAKSGSVGGDVYKALGKQESVMAELTDTVRTIYDRLKPVMRSDSEGKVIGNIDREYFNSDVAQRIDAGTDVVESRIIELREIMSRLEI